jgi:selenocysteine-specific elongation factor
VSEIHPIIIGTAGHVDHGKSSLVRALTGVDPDRWEEEKKRGLTIDLGFAPLELPGGLRAGLIDVPGHERFLKNMVAGATSIDLAILVVAADDAVMPQTREHLDILDLLGVERGLVALTKVDLVDQETLELAQEDVLELLEGRCLEGAEIYPMSTITGEGVETFRKRLEELAQEVSPRSSAGFFRMPVQRKFSVKGFGSVLTGIPVSGQVAVGEELYLVGKRQKSRIRGIQAYGSKVEVARTGHSTALNLPDIDLDQVERGDVVSASPDLEPTYRIEAELRVVRDMLPLKYGEEVHLHIGTKEAMARVFPLDQAEILPGQSGLAQIHVLGEVVTLSGDFLLLRRLNPPRTIAGGRVIGIGGRRLRRLREEVVERLQKKEQALDQPEERVRLLVEEAGAHGIMIEDCRAKLGWTQEEMGIILEPMVGEKKVYQDPRTRRLFSERSIALEKERIEKMLGGWFRKHPTSTTCPVSRFRNEKAVEDLLQMTLLELEAQGRLASQAGGRLRDLTRQDPLSEAQRKQAAGIRAWLDEAGFRPHAKKELLENHGKDSSLLLECMLEEGQAVETGDGFLWGAESFARAVELVEGVCSEHDGVLDIPTLRDRMQTSRKFLIPFLEHMDRLGITARKGDRRIFRRK